MSTPRFSNNGRHKGPNPQPRAEYSKNVVDVRLDKLTELWAVMEAKLLGMQPPRQIAVNCIDVHDEHGDEVGGRYLGVQRIGGKWRVCYGEGWHGKEPTEWRPIVECDIETRVRLAGYVQRLEYQVKETGRTFLPELDEAIAELEKHVLENVDDD
jgi:hypothetical protein